MSKQDYYDVLGVDRGADAATLKKAFRKAAMQYHPDRNPDNKEAEAKFKELNEAYEALKDPDKRAAYDRYGHDAFAQGGMGGGNPFGGGAGGFDFADVFEEFFGDMMGGGRRGRGRGGRSGAQRGDDIRFNLEVTLEESFTGKTQEIKVPSSVSCNTCEGSGAEPGTSPETCGTCNGYGKVRANQGLFTVERTCPHCRGTGQMITSPCGDCRGAGVKQKTKNLTVKIPAGVEDGTRIRLSGEGQAGTLGGPTGDLYIFMSVRPHPLFKRDGELLFCEVPVTMVKATLGGDMEIPTIDGKQARLKIPEGTQTGNQFRLRGKGMPNLNGTRVGDLIIEANVETPVNLSEKQRKILEQFASEGGDKINPKSEGFFTKVKELWEDFTD